MTRPAFILAALCVVAVSAEAQSRRNQPPFATAVTSVKSYYTNSPALSPDGRWIVFTSDDAGSSWLSIVPTAGGEPREMTPRADRDRQGTWFPGGNRIAYVSDRLKGIVVSDFDTGAGRLVGPPRRVTVEPTSSFGISPDGKWIAYVVGRGPSGRWEGTLKIVPATGGAPRVLHEHDANVRNPRFSPDGKEILFSVVGRAQPYLRDVLRIAVDGGKASAVVRMPAVNSASNVIVEPRHQRLLFLQQGSMVITTFAGETTAVLNTPGVNNAGTPSFGNDAGTLYIARDDVAAVIRTISLADGKSRDASDSSDYFWPAGWSNDGKRVFYTANGAPGVHSATIDGRDRRVTPFAPTVPLDTVPGAPIEVFSVSGDGRYWFLTRRHALNLRRGYVYDSESRVLRQVTDSLGGTVEEPGGDYLHYQPASNSFVFVERSGRDAAHALTTPRHIVSVAMDGTKRYLRQLPAARDSARYFAVLGDGRFAWLRRFPDSSVLLTARGNEPPQRVWSTRDPVIAAIWSRDMKNVAIIRAASKTPGRSGSTATFLAVDEAGRARETATSPTFGDWWDMYWSGDNRSLIALEYETGFDTGLIRIPANGGALSYVVEGGRMTFWDHYLSPDGMHTMIPAEVPRGSTIWRIDVRAAEAAYRQRKR